MLGGQDKCIGQVETTGGEDRWQGQVARKGGEGRWRGQVVRMLEEKWPFASSPGNMNDYFLNDEND